MRNKRNRKLMSILLTLSLLVTLLVPMVGPASAATDYSMSNVKTVKAGNTTDDGTLATKSILGTLQIDIPSLVLNGGYLFLDLPSSPTNYKWNGLAASIPTEVNGNDNAVGAVKIEMTSDRIAKLSVTSVYAPGNDGRIILGYNLDTTASIPPGTYPVNATTTASATFNRGNSVEYGMNVYIPSGVSGAVTLSMVAPSGSNLNGGTVTLANVGTGKVTVSSESVVNIGSAGGDVGLIDLKEDIAGSLVNSGSSVKLTLPPGFSWSSAGTDTVYWGDDATPSVKGIGYSTSDNNGRDLKVAVNQDSTLGVHAKASFFAIKAHVDVDESVAKTGDITVTVSGDSTTTPSSIVIGKYGDYSVSTTAVEKLDITAGKSDAKIGKFSINEALAGSLTPQRTITLTLPDGAKWTTYPGIDTDTSKAQDQVQWDTSGTFQINGWVPVGSDMKTIKRTVKSNDGSVENAGSLDPASIVFKDGKIVTGPDFKAGDLKVTVGGSMGVTGDLILANVTSMVTAKADTAPDIKIGLPDQAAGDLTIVESSAGAIDSNLNWSERTTKTDGTYLDGKLTANSNSDQTKMRIEAPPGVRFASTPTVAVTDGDLQIDQSGVKIDTGDNGDDTVLIIPIKSQSTKASTIKITGITVTVDRTVPEGNLDLKVKGNAVNEALDKDGKDTWLAGATTAAKVTIAKTVTPADRNTKATAVFKIGDTKFTLNGADQTMDAAPYLKNDRTYLPLRFVAKAVGVTDSNIIWNADEQSVTLIKDGSIVKLTIGSTTMTINGTPITMDVAPEIVDPGRTMLPVRWVAQALGANIQWDNATQTVTVN